MAQTTVGLISAVRSGRGWPIGLIISMGLISAMLLVAGSISIIGYNSAKIALLATAEKTARGTGELINAKARVLLDPAQATLRQLSFDPIVDATTIEQRLARLYVLSDELAANPMVASIYVGYDNGEFFLARPLDNAAIRARFQAPAGSNFMVQARTLQRDGSIKGEFIFFDADSVIEQRRVVPEYTFDPRTRPWYVAADQTDAPVVSRPYVFFTTEQIGVSLSQLTRMGRSIAGIDMVLDDISATIGTLKISPNADIALVNEDDEVLAYPDMQKALIRSDNAFNFVKVQNLSSPVLQALHALKPAPNAVNLFEVQGEEVLGVSVPFDIWPNVDMRLLIAAPTEELLGELAVRKRQIMWGMAFLVAALIPLGWLAGGRIGHGLNRLSAQARRIGRFDFERAAQEPSRIREVNQLNTVLDDMSHTIQSFLQLSHQMAVESEVDQMLTKVLQQLVSATRCTSAQVYLWDASTERMERAAWVGDDPSRFAQGFGYSRNRKGRNEARKTPANDMLLELELRGRNGQLQGLLGLVHPVGSSHNEPAFVDFVRQLSGSLAVAIETRQLIDAQKNLLDGVIKLMADAIDAKSPYTGGHCERVPDLAIMLVDRMHADPKGAYADFRMTEEQRYEFYLGAWLHDCGKVTSPEHIVDKATKLEVIYNRIHEVRTRFEVLWRDAEIEHLKRLAAGTPEADSVAQRDQVQQQLRDDFAFVAQCNIGGEFMADAAVQRLQTVASQTWQRHFDDSLGVSAEESRRLQASRARAPDLPVTETLLADRADHIVAWEGKRPPVERGDPANVWGFDMKLPTHKQNMGELYNLSIRRGTLTEEDRFKINDHIVQTYIMLSGLPWPDNLRRVPSIAATHHEKMDGKGYPRGLSAKDLTVVDKAMALADVFEALTAADRPYKSAKTLTESLRIMVFMCKDQHLDTEMFRYFLYSGLWLDYAKRNLKPEQIDTVDVAALERMLPQAPPEAELSAQSA
jgi:HD-GYP domain-containing protein (c-di-GMP phosphodiesterase class II)